MLPTVALCLFSANEKENVIKLTADEEEEESNRFIRSYYLSILELRILDDDPLRSGIRRARRVFPGNLNFLHLSLSRAFSNFVRRFRNCEGKIFVVGYFYGLK